MAQDKRFHVAIVGGGIAGPALALNLKKLHGISCSVYERSGSVEIRGVNIALGPNAVRVLQHIGVYHTLRSQGCSYEKLTISNARGQVLGGFFNGSEKYYNYAALRIHRAKVQNALLEEAELQNIDVKFGMKLTDLKEEDTGVKLTFANGQTAEADFVVGADGVYSKVRPHVVQCELEYSGFMGIIGMTIDKDTLRSSAKTTNFPNFCYGQTGFVAMMPANVPATELDFFSTMPAPARSRKEWEDLGNDPDELQKIVRSRFGQNWPEHIKGIAADYPKERLALYPFFQVPELEHWTSAKGRIIMIGDGAHAMTPQAGQGAAMALEDAESLGYTFARNNFSTDYFRLLRTWEKHRQERLKAVKDFTNKNGRLRCPESTWIAQYLKEWFMWAVFHLTGTKSGMNWLFGYSAEDVIGTLRI